MILPPQLANVCKLNFDSSIQSFTKDYTFDHNLQQHYSNTLGSKYYILHTVTEIRFYTHPFMSKILVRNKVSNPL